MNMFAISVAADKTRCRLKTFTPLKMMIADPKFCRIQKRLCNYIDFSIFIQT